MKFEVFEAKTLEDAKKAALEEMNVSEEEIISTYEEKKGKLFKAGSVLFKAIKITDVADFIKNNLKELLENMNIEAQFETNIRNSQINIKNRVPCPPPTCSVSASPDLLPQNLEISATISSVNTCKMLRFVGERGARRVGEQEYSWNPAHAPATAGSFRHAALVNVTSL